jgi:hypothetical protein
VLVCDAKPGRSPELAEDLAVSRVHVGQMNFRVLRSLIVASMIEGVLALSACGDNTGPPVGPPPTAPSPAPAPRPAPPPSPTFPSIAIGDVVRFSFAVDDTPCVGGGGRCRSYNVTVPADGTLQAVLTSVSGTDASLRPPRCMSYREEIPGTLARGQGSVSPSR